MIDENEKLKGAITDKIALIEKERKEILQVETKSKLGASQHQNLLNSTKEAYQQQCNLWKNQVDKLEDENISLKNKFNALTVKLNEEEFKTKMSEQTYVSKLHFLEIYDRYVS